MRRYESVSGVVFGLLATAVRGKSNCYRGQAVGGIFSRPLAAELQRWMTT